MCCFLGESSGLLSEAFGDKISWSLATSMIDAVSRAFNYAQEGDVVLLAPACSSFDMFKDFEHRGVAFKEAVRSLKHSVIEKAYHKHDSIILIAVLLLIGVGLIAIFSASSILAEQRYGDHYYYLKKQGVFCLFGLLLMIVATHINYLFYRSFVYFLWD